MAKDSVKLNVIVMNSGDVGVLFLMMVVVHGDAIVSVERLN